MAHELPPLPYDFSALEPHIDTQTMQIHHGKHHQAYVNNLNAALEKHPNLQGKSAEELVRNLGSVPEDIRPAVRNNGGGHVNHTMFWKMMAPNAGGAPTGAVAEAIKASFGSFDAFKEQFAKAGVEPFRQRLGVAHRQQRQAVDREHGQPGQPDLGRQEADPRHRRVGARLLPEVPEPPPRLHHRVVERGELGGGESAVRTISRRRMQGRRCASDASPLSEPLTSTIVPSSTRSTSAAISK